MLLYGSNMHEETNTEIEDTMKYHFSGFRDSSIESDST